MSFSHLDGDGHVHMVDVGDKQPTRRTALARGRVVFPAEVFAALRAVNGQTKKGAMLEVAHIAGVLGAKKTSDLIPLCHPLPLDQIALNFDYDEAGSAVVITASVGVTHKTGVEMEALTAVSIAALTLYDMTKAMSHAIVIQDIRLLEKTGGKSDYH